MRYEKIIESAGEYDVVVCGGGFAGFGAACAAAREGANVILIERNKRTLHTLCYGAKHIFHKSLWIIQKSIISYHNCTYGIEAHRYIKWE